MPSDKPLPRVTWILKAVGMIDAAWFTQYDLERGHAVHEACALLARGELDHSSLDPAIVGRVEAWGRFLADVSPRITHVERELVAKDYAGRCDYCADIGSDRYVLDLKGPSIAPWHAVQLAAYSDVLPVRAERANIYLHNDGSYRVKVHRHASDFDVWRDALRRFKEMQPA